MNVKLKKILNEGFLKKNSDIENKEIYTLYSIRFFLFITIFVQHCYNFVKIPILNQPALGVSGFIILSGFLNGLIYIDKEIKLKDTFKITVKRIKKFYPLHIMMLLLTIPLTNVFSLTNFSSCFDFCKKLVCNVFFSTKLD